MATLLKSVTGSWAGPTSKFRVVAQIWMNKDTGSGYDLFLRRYIEVKSGSSFGGTTLTTSWGSVSISSAGNYLVKDTQLGEKAYGATYSLSSSSIKAYYTGGSGTTYSSSASISYTVPKPTYTVSYDANGGSGSMESDVVGYGDNYKTKANAFTRSGYEWIGWNEEPDGSGVDWTDWVGVDWKYSYKKSITLYAIWKSKGMMCLTQDGVTKKGKPFLYEGTTAKSGILWINVNGVWKKGGA